MYVAYHTDLAVAHSLHQQKNYPYNSQQLNVLVKNQNLRYTPKCWRTINQTGEKRINVQYVVAVFK